MIIPIRLELRVARGFIAVFGKPFTTAVMTAGFDVPQSDTMAQNGWNSALKVSVNKYPPNAGEAGINLYPAAWSSTEIMPCALTCISRSMISGSIIKASGARREKYAAFGIKPYGTNCNWRLDINPRVDGAGARPINADGEWCCIDAASGAVTPADYGHVHFAGLRHHKRQLRLPVHYERNINIPFTNADQSSPGVYTLNTNIFGNSGVPNDQQSANNTPAASGPSPQQGIIKNPPFSGIQQQWWRAKL